MARDVSWEWLEDDLGDAYANPSDETDKFIREIEELLGDAEENPRLMGRNYEDENAFVKTVKVKGGKKEQRVFHDTKIHGGKLAKRAMEIRRDKGVSLKEAWRLAKIEAGLSPDSASKKRRKKARDEAKANPVAPRKRRKMTVARRARKNARAMAEGRTFTGRFHRPCAVCGGDTYGDVLKVVGIGPRGGKVLAHANCAR